MMAGVILMGALVLFFANIGFVQGFIGNVPGCRPRKVLVTIGAPHYRHFPYFIEVYRCNGVCSTSFTPKEQKCTAVTLNNITGNVYDFSTRSLKAITVQNHTSCSCQCVATAKDCSENEQFNEDSCRCVCKYEDEPPRPCPERFRWNKGRCKCVCSRPVDFCDIRKEWSPEFCGCICTRWAVDECKAQNKYVNASTCECVTLVPKSTGPGVTGRRVTEGVMDWRRIAAVMVAELIVLVFLFDLYLCCRYEKGVIHCILAKCRSRSNDTANESTEQANDHVLIRNNVNHCNHYILASQTNASNGTASFNHENHNQSPSLNRYKSIESIV